MFTVSGGSPLRSDPGRKRNQSQNGKMVIYSLEGAYRLILPEFTIVQKLNLNNQRYLFLFLTICLSSNLQHMRVAEQQLYSLIIICPRNVCVPKWKKYMHIFFCFTLIHVGCSNQRQIQVFSIRDLCSYSEYQPIIKNRS